MRLDYFTKFGYTLLETYHREPSEIVWQEVHDWLADAPYNIRESDIELWPCLLDAALQSQRHREKHEEDCIASLGNYFSWLANASEKLLLKHLMDSSFANILHNTSGKAMVQAVQLGWNPTSLMTRLNDLNAPVSDRYDDPTLYDMIRNFYHALLPLLAQEGLVLAPHPLYANVLDVYVIDGHRPASHGETIIRRLVKVCPEKLHRIMAFLGNENYLQEGHVDALFPLPLKSVPQEHTHALLHALVGLVVEAPGYAAEETMPLLRQHHPELAALIALHTAVFSGITREQTYAEVLVEPYQQMLNGAACNTTVDSIDSGVFDDPCIIS